jgi:3-oxoacid CoA-transferase subunit A
VYRLTARNFNPLAAMCGTVTFAEAEHIVELGDLDPDTIHTPGVYVHHVTQALAAKDIEQRTVRPRRISEEVAS